MSTIHFDLRPVPNPVDKAFRGYFPVVAEQYRTTVSHMLETIEKRSTISSADMKGMLDALSSYICENLCMGNRVDVPGLGTFSPQIVSDEPIMLKNDPQTARHLHVGGILFIPKKEVMGKLQAVTFHRTSRPHRTHEVLSDAVTMSRLRDHLQRTGRPTFSRSEFQLITGYTRTRVVVQLAHLVQQGLIVEGGHSRYRLYWLAQPDADKA